MSFTFFYISFFLLLLSSSCRSLPFEYLESSSVSMGIVTLPYNFSLSALNVTLPNTDENGSPLVLGQNGATAGVVPHVTSTLASYPFNDYPALALVKGALYAYRADRSWNTNATEVHSGSTLGWITSTRYTSPAPEIYSVLNSPLTRFPLLAAHGRHDLWSLCPFPGRREQTNVVFNVSAAMDPKPGTGAGFDPKRCYEVVLLIIGVWV